MKELLQLLKPPREESPHTRECWIDEVNKTFVKDLKISKSFYDDCDPEVSYRDFRDHVQGGINFIRHKHWGLREMIPEARVDIEGDEIEGFSCKVTSSLVDGWVLTGMAVIPEEVKDQLAYFVGCCVPMALESPRCCVDKPEIIIPDLLGGVQKPTHSFHNMMVEKTTGNLFYIDTYPLARFSPGNNFWEKKNRVRYACSLIMAAEEMKHARLMENSQNLAVALLSY